MAGAKSGRKGKAFERLVGKVLGEWWQNKSFRRTPISGGWDKDALGDLVVPAEFPFLVECKKHRNWSLEAVVCNRGLFRQWWGKISREAESVGKSPLLIMCRDRGQIFAAFLRSWLEGVDQDSLSLVNHVFIGGVDVGQMIVVLALDEALGLLSIYKPYRSLASSG